MNALYEKARILLPQWQKQLKNPGFLGEQLITFVILAAYCLLFGFYTVSIRQLPRGVNYNFTHSLWPLLLVLVLLVAWGYWRVRKDPMAHTQAAQTGRGAWPLLLLPLTPIVQYVLNNLRILTAADIAYLLALFTLLSAGLVFFIPALFRKSSLGKSLQVLSLALVFLLFNMASLSATFSWYARGNFLIQLLIFSALASVIGYLFQTNRQLLYLLIAGFFISNSFAQISFSGPAPEPPGNPLIQELTKQELVTKPNVYFLVYDSYVANETMLQYGIDNGAQERYLVENGFTLYPHTYSIGAWSSTSMSTVLDISPEYTDEAKAAAGNGTVPNVFKNQGYTTFGIFPSDYFFRGSPSAYDVSFPERRASTDLLTDGIFLGEFRFDLGYNNQTTLNFYEQKQAQFQALQSQPFFLYAHSGSPGHSQNSGACLPNEKEIYAENLELANQEMRTDLATILANDPTAIVVVAGDHGPYLSKNCASTTRGGYNLREITRYDIQDRFGTFLAIRWPTPEFTDYDQITVLQDLFPAIFSYLFEDPAILSGRIPTETLYSKSLVSGAYVEDGIIQGGVNDGEPLFTSP